MRVKSRKCILVGIIYLNNTYKSFIFDVELTNICYVFISWKFILFYRVHHGLLNVTILQCAGPG